MNLLRKFSSSNNAGSMSFSRFEAFSDGVFAIAITLLIVEVEVPDLSRATSSQAVELLLHVWPHLLSYVTSFFVIGVIWLNHHALFHLLKRVDRLTLTLNILLLMCVAFVPYPTALLGHYGHLQPVVIFYGGALTILGVVWNILWFRVVRYYLTAPAATSGAASDTVSDQTRVVAPAALRAATWWGLAWPVAYATAALLSFVSNTLSLVLYAAIPLFYLLPSALDREARNH